MRSKIRRFLIVFCLFLTISGCSASSTVFIGAVENSTNTSWSNHYVRFSGHEIKTITVREGSPVEVFVSIKTESGKLGLSIIGKDGTSCYEGNELQTTDFSVTIDNPGEYDITVTADKHKGGFDFYWK